MNPDLVRMLEARLEEIAAELQSKRIQWDDLNVAIQKLEQEEANIRVLIPAGGIPSPLQGDLIPLSDFQVIPGERPPSELVLPSGLKRPLKIWKDIIIEASRHLVSVRKIRTDLCPIAKPRARKETLIDLGLPNPDATYSEPVEIGAGLWLETHGGAYELWEKACFVIENAGDDPKQYFLRR